MFKIPTDKDIAIYINDPQLFPIVASSTAPPFVYIAQNPDDANYARTIFENFNLTLGKDVFVASQQELDAQIPVLPPNMKLDTGNKINIKMVTENLTKLGYARVPKIEDENSFSIRGDIIDVWPLQHHCPLRILFFDNEIEAIKVIDINNFTSIKSIDTCEIPAIPEHCIPDKWQSGFEAFRNKTQLFVTDKQDRLEVWHTSKPFNPLNAIIIKTAPVANYFSALSILVPEIIWNVNTRKKTVLVFVGTSRACEKYMDTKGIPYVISTPDNFTPNAINIIRKHLGASFELIEEKIVVYSLQKLDNREKGVYEKDYGEFTLPPIGGLVIHEQHGLGRYLGIKKMQLHNEERDYIVLQYDGGSFVYLPPERTHELMNFNGSPRRLDRI